MALDCIGADIMSIYDVYVRDTSVERPEQARHHLLSNRRRRGMSTKKMGHNGQTRVASDALI